MLATSLNLSPADIYYHAIEIAFLSLVIYLALTRAYKPWNRAAPAQLTDTQVAAKLAAWKPAPLAAPLSQQEKDALPLDLTTYHDAFGNFQVNGKDNVTDMATCNFLGLLKDPTVEEKCLATMKEYGCGACGPRGFYGTTDIHLECEEKIAAFSGTETAILYSFGSATGNSTIPAFCKRGDLVVCDDSLNFSLQLGVELSRAEVIRFKHNDMADLERILKEVTDGDVADPGRRKIQRRIIIVEGIYQNVGDLCPLDEVVALKEKYLFRVMLDESFSLGVLGKTGRGTLEHFGIKREVVDIATADLGNAIASVGGFCVGSEDVVKHQRLSGAGYCFSASQPPFLAMAASVALDIVSERGETFVSRLRDNVDTFRKQLDIHSLKQAGWYVDGHQLSPLMHIRAYDDTLPLATFTTLQKECLDNDVLIARPVYAQSEVNPPRPCVRVTVSVAHSERELQKAATVIRQVLLSSRS